MRVERQSTDRCMKGDFSLEPARATRVEGRTSVPLPLCLSTASATGRRRPAAFGSIPTRRRYASDVSVLLGKANFGMLRDRV